ncbi:MAG: peptidylprolyl isomerase [Cellulophaga sp.]
MKKVSVLLIAIVLVMTNCKSSKHADLGDGVFADIITNKGEIIIKLEYEKTPVTVASFVSLAEGESPFVSENLKGKKYFDGLIFHRIIKDFMIQGGDPTGTGTGNPGYKFKDEFNDSLTHHKAGILSMANSGPVTNGSQFFITHKETPFLNGRHTVFGEVIEGLNIVDSIANVKTADRDKPVDDVIMKTVEIIRNGKVARKFDAVQIMTDYFEEAEATEKEAALKKAAIEAEKKNLIAKFIADIAAQKTKAKSLPSGLKIFTLKKGTGVKPKVGQKVGVYYAGYLDNGTLFDSNIESVATKYGKFDQRRKDGKGYEPNAMDYSPDAQLVAGFKEGLLSMNVGDKIRIFFPPHLGYGAQGGGPIPPNADLIFDLEITEVIK